MTLSDKMFAVAADLGLVSGQVDDRVEQARVVGALAEDLSSGGRRQNGNPCQGDPDKKARGPGAKETKSVLQFADRYS